MDDTSSRRYRRRANAERNWQVFLRVAFIGAYCLALLVAGIYLGHRSRESSGPEPLAAEVPPAGGQEETLPQSEDLPAGGPGYVSSAEGNPDPAPDMTGQETGEETLHDTKQEIPQATGETQGGLPGNDEELLGDADDSAVPAAALSSETPIWPVQGEIVREPGWVFSDYLNEWRYLPGVEIAVAPDTPVTAVMSGKVKSVFTDPDLGNVVALEHPDGTTTEYGRLSGCILGVGDTVKQGEEFARTDGTSLYFAAKVNDEIIPVTKLLSP